MPADAVQGVVAYGRHQVAQDVQLLNYGALAATETERVAVVDVITIWAVAAGHIHLNQ
tara:strand:- start:2289 stop:2462 length:174 start_codon:yes stop_codon:yes gene_type:complete